MTTADVIGLAVWDGSDHDPAIIVGRCLGVYPGTASPAARAPDAVRLVETAKRDATLAGDSIVYTVDARDRGLGTALTAALQHIGAGRGPVAVVAAAPGPEVSWAIILAPPTTDGSRACCRIGVQAIVADDASAALRSVCEGAGWDPASIGLLHMAGGTPPGPSLAALVAPPDRRSSNWAIESDTGDEPRCAAQFLRLLAAVHDRVVPACPPSARPDAPDRASSAPRPWIHGAAAPGRRALLLSFNESTGTAVHFEEENPFTPRAAWADCWPHEICVLSADDRDGLLGRMTDLQAELAAERHADAIGLATALSAAPTKLVRLAILAANGDDLSRLLAIAMPLVAADQRGGFVHPAGIYYAAGATRDPPGTAFLFSGQGSQYFGMLRDLAIRVPAVREWLDLLDGYCPRELNPLPSRVVYAPSDLATTPQVQARLHALACGGQACLVGAMAVSDFVRRLGVKPTAMIGHSNGENAALFASRTIRTKTRKGIFTTLAHMSGIFSTSDQSGRNQHGITIAVSLPANFGRDALALLLGGDSFVTMDNCPQQIVVWGPPDRIAELTATLKQRGCIVVPLPLTQAYHTPVFAAAAERFAADYELLDLGEGDVVLYSGQTAAPFPAEPREIARVAHGQWSRQVRFRDAVERMHADGVGVFVDVGPGGRLAGFVRDTLRGKAHTAVAADVESHSGAPQWLKLIAQLFVVRRLDDIGALFRTRRPGTHAQDVAQSSSPAATRAQAPPKWPLAIAQRGTGSALRNEIRAKIAQEHFVLMRYFLDSTETVFTALAQRLAADRTSEHTSPSEPASSLRQYAPQIEIRTRARLRASLHLTPHEQRFLLDHAFGMRQTARTEARYGLPVMPLAFSIEIAAAAARELIGTIDRVVKIEDIAGYQWLAVEGPAIDIIVDATQTPSEPGAHRHVVKVKLLNKSAALTTPALTFECTVVLARHHPAAPAARASATSPTDDASISAESFQERLFHGPSFRSMTRTLGVGPGEVAVGLRVPTDAQLFASGTATLETPAPFIDVAGQILAYHEKLVSHGPFGLFPFAIRAIELFAPPLPPGAEARANARLEKAGDDILGDVDFLSGAGDVLYRVRGMRTKYFKWEARWERVLFGRGPRLDLGQTVPIESGRRLRVVQDFADDLLEAGQRIWLRVLAASILTPEEAAMYERLPHRGPRRPSWLLGRAAAKEAAHDWLAEHGVRSVEIADIAITNNSFGQPEFDVDVSGETHLPAHLPPLSISHTGDWAVAAIGHTGETIGVDAERRSGAEMADGAAAYAFTHAERPFLERHGRARLWCAKEAVAKALGTGLMGAPSQFVVADVSPDGLWAAVEVANRRLDVRFCQHPDLIIAVCWLPVGVAAQIRAELTAALPALAS